MMWNRTKSPGLLASASIKQGKFYTLWRRFFSRSHTENQLTATAMEKHLVFFVGTGYPMVSKVFEQSSVPSLQLPGPYALSLTLSGIWECVKLSITLVMMLCFIENGRLSWRTRARVNLEKERAWFCWCRLWRERGAAHWRAQQTSMLHTCMGTYVKECQSVAWGTEYEARQGARRTRTTNSTAGTEFCQ